MNNLIIKIKSLGHFLDYIVKNLVTKSFYFILHIFHMNIYGQMKLLFDAYNPVVMPFDFGVACGSLPTYEQI